MKELKKGTNTDEIIKEKQKLYKELKKMNNANEIVKEKLYTVVIPTDDISPLQAVLCKNVDNKIVVDIITLNLNVGKKWINTN